MQKLQDCVALVTGANRGLGRAYCEGFRQAGAAKAYAAARDPSNICSKDSRVVPLALDITSTQDVLSAASWFTNPFNPFMATYCASKAAEEVLTSRLQRLRLGSGGSTSPGDHRLSISAIN